MPYIDGKRVSNEEWTRQNGSLREFHTGPDGDNPASAPELDEETQAPKVKSKKAGSQRSKRTEKAAKAAVADALGVKSDSPALADIDVSGLDAPAQNEEAE